MSVSSYSSSTHGSGSTFVAKARLRVARGTAVVARRGRARFCRTHCARKLGGCTRLSARGADHATKWRARGPSPPPPPASAEPRHTERATPRVHAQARERARARGAGRKGQGLGDRNGGRRYLARPREGRTHFAAAAPPSVQQPLDVDAPGVVDPLFFVGHEIAPHAVPIDRGRLYGRTTTTLRW